MIFGDLFQNNYCTGVDGTTVQFHFCVVWTGVICRITYVPTQSNKESWSWGAPKWQQDACLNASSQEKNKGKMKKRCVCVGPSFALGEKNSPKGETVDQTRKPWKPWASVERFTSPGWRWQPNSKDMAWKIDTWNQCKRNGEFSRVKRRKISVKFSRWKRRLIGVWFALNRDRCPEE